MEIQHHVSGFGSKKIKTGQYITMLIAEPYQNNKI